MLENFYRSSLHSKNSEPFECLTKIFSLFIFLYDVSECQCHAVPHFTNVLVSIAAAIDTEREKLTHRRS